MAAEENKSPFIPLKSSLEQRCLVKLSIKFLQNFELNTLRRVFAEIQGGCSQGIKKDSKENLQESLEKKWKIQSIEEIKNTDSQCIRVVFKTNEPSCSASNPENHDESYNRAKEHIQFIPKFLRSRVIETVFGLNYSIQNWMEKHFKIIKLEDIEAIYIRPEGIIDSFKTAEQMVQNENIDLKVRFHLACAYCLEESVQTLWAELEASGETSNEPIARFWIEWLRDENRVPWIQAIPEFLMLNYNIGIFVRLGSFFPFLRPEERKEVVPFLKEASLDDVAFCLQALPEEEKENILFYHAPIFLGMYLEWPFRSLLFEAANNFWKYMIDLSILDILQIFFELKRKQKEYNYKKLFSQFWHVTPSEVKKKAEETEIFKEKIDKWLKEGKDKELVVPTTSKNV